MIKINLLAERKQAKAKGPAIAKIEGGPGAGPTVVLMGILLAGVAVAGGWWWQLDTKVDGLRVDHEQADQELQRLAEIRAKGEAYKKQKELLARKINLITELKKKQAAPVHILDQVSKNLPEMVWLDQLSSNDNQISVTGKATNYNAVSSFYQNLTDSGYFRDVTLGRTFEVREGVSFSLTCRFDGATPPADANVEQQG